MGIRTIAKSGESLFKDKGSKHFGFTFKVANEEEAKQHIDTLRQDHSKANHVCFAYKINAKPHKIERFSDDGEPANSAGPPIFHQIEKHKLNNTLIAVVRYFGGTKLGVGGLIHAYRTAAEQAIENSSIIETEPIITLNIEVPFDCIGDLNTTLAKEKTSIIDNRSNASAYCVVVEIEERTKTKLLNSLSYLNASIQEI